MKLVINELEGAVKRQDGVISLPAVGEDGAVHTIEITPKAQERLFLPLIASSGRDPASPGATHIHVRGLGRFQKGAERGLSFLMTPDIALHVVMPPPLAEELQKFLQSWDDPTSWDLKGPTKQ